MTLGLFIPQMDKEPLQQSGHLDKVTGPVQNSTPFSCRLFPFPTSHPLPARERLDFLLTRTMIYVGWAQLAPSSLGQPSAPLASS
jgi:hypothetical protein